MNMDNKQETIDKIYKEYFDIVDDFFGGIKHHLGSEEDSHIELGAKIAGYPLISDLVLDAIDDLDSEIEKFWKNNAQIVFDFIKKQDALKCLYSGDISPVILEHFVKKTALYIDTVILPDPLFNLSLFHKQVILDKKFYLNKLIRHVFNIWRLKGLVLANTEHKIIMILPISIQLVSRADRKRLLTTAGKRFTTYTNEIFDQNLEDTESCLDFFSQQTSSKAIFNKIDNHNLLPRVFAKQDTLDEFLADFNSTARYTQFTDKSLGWSFGTYLQAQFIRVQEHKYFCNRLIAEPIYDYDLPWFFFNYEMGGLGMDAAIANALQSENFDWISKVPISALRVLREENRLDYMRNVLRNGLTDLKTRNDKMLLKVSKQIENNFEEAFKRQASQLKCLEKEVKKITNKEIPITTGGFFAGFIPYLGNVVSIVSAGRDIVGLIKERSKAKQEIAEKENDFINILMKSYDK